MAESKHVGSANLLNPRLLELNLWAYPSMVGLAALPKPMLTWAHLVAKTNNVGLTRG